MAGSPLSADDKRSFPERDEGAAIDKRTAELIAPYANHHRNAEEHVEKTIRDGWAGSGGRELIRYLSTSICIC